jgi:hypothetical protein
LLALIGTVKRDGLLKRLEQLVQGVTGGKTAG